MNDSKHIPELEPKTTLSINPIHLAIAGRSTPLELRITLPVKGNKLPVILLSHGHGPSLYIASKDGYEPLVNYYAGQGFAVIQPTHANSRVAGLDNDHSDAPLFLNERILEMTTILDNLDLIQSRTPFLNERLDKQRIAVVRHSAGAMTAAMLMGMNNGSHSSPTPTKKSTLDTRIKVGILLASVGKGEDLHQAIKEKFSDLHPDYSSMTTRNLVVYGDADNSSHFTDRAADWHADPFHLSSASDYLLCLIGGKHGLGGVAGYDAKETDDEDPDRLTITQKMTAAYLRAALNNDESIWTNACDSLESFASNYAYIETK